MTTAHGTIARTMLLSLALCAPAAWAQYTPPSPSTQPPPMSSTPSSPAKKELVARILASQKPGIESIAVTLAERSVGPLTQAVGQALAKMPADKRQAASKQAEAEVRKYLDDTTPALRERAVALGNTVVGPMLEEKFTEEELRQLAAWFESPVNRKYLQVAPEMQNALAQKLVADNRPMIEPKLRATEERVMAQLGVTVKPSAGASAASAPAKPAAPVRKP